MSVTKLLGDYSGREFQRTSIFNGALGQRSRSWQPAPMLKPERTALHTTAGYRASLVFLLLLSVCISIFANPELTVPIGFDAYRQWQRWPVQRIGVRAYMRSTY